MNEARRRFSKAERRFDGLDETDYGQFGHGGVLLLEGIDEPVICIPALRKIGYGLRDKIHEFCGNPFHRLEHAGQAFP